MKKTMYSLALAGILSFAVGCNTEIKETSTAESKYKAGVEKVFNAFMTGNADGLEAYIDSNFVEHTPPPGIEIKGIQGFKNWVKMNHDAFPDLKMTILDIVEQGDMAMVHWHWKGTNSGDMGPGMPATNKPVDCNGVDIMKYKDGKCTEHWGYFEESKMMTQLGMMPPMDGAPVNDSTKNAK